MHAIAVAEEQRVGEPLSMVLRRVLDEQYVIVDEPLVQGRRLDVLLVGPQGLLVVYGRDWRGIVHPAQHGPWREELPDGRHLSHANPLDDAPAVEQALQSFLLDEAPTLQPAIFQLVVLPHEAQLAMSLHTTRLGVATLDTLGETLAALTAVPAQALGPDVRVELARMFEERQLTRSQRATTPFTFRRSGLLGLGREAWTVRQVIAHIDRYPADGVHHLKNGTLEQWFSAQGAHHLARLAREAMGQAESNPRITLEQFLLATGMVSRPRLRTYPATFQLGYALSGETLTRRLRLHKRRGRGYLYGAVQGNQPWIRVQPGTFAGVLDAVVTVDTAALMIQAEKTTAAVLVRSSASEEPIEIPLGVHVMPSPAPVNRYVFRPLFGLFVGLLLGLAVAGAGVSWALAPAWALGLAPTLLRGGWLWLLAITALWGSMGAARGLTQRPAWPSPYALVRWLANILAWWAILALGVLGLVWAGGWILARAGLDVTGLRPLAIIIGALAIAVIPATLGEKVASTFPSDRVAASEVQRGARRLLAHAGRWVVIVAVLVATRLLGVAWERYDLGERLVQTQAQVTTRWKSWESGLSRLVDRAYLRYYDRRAPHQPVATPVRTPANRVGTGG